MARSPGEHLSPDELASLSEIGETLAPPSPGVDMELAGRHAAACSHCGDRLQAHRRVGAKLVDLARGPFLNEPAGCPSDEEWPRLLASPAPASAATLLEHAASCDRCGPRLRDLATATLGDPAPQDAEVVRALESSRPEWQARLADRLARLSDDTPFEEHRVALAQASPRRPRFSMPAWVAAAAVIVCATGLGTWQTLQRRALTATDALISTAYSETRPFAYRLPGVRFGPLREQRGAHGLSSRSQALLEAELQIRRKLSSSPGDLDWLRRKARAGLIEGDWDTAIAALEQSRAADGRDAGALAELGIAIARKADAEGPSGYPRALELLTQALHLDSRDRVALFNRALVNERMGNRASAIQDTKSYLELDPSGDWASEARERLARLEQSEPR